jgi:uncharacterized protein
MELSKKPQGTTVIVGFPGFGLVGTIATGFLIDHLECERIQQKWFEDLPATLALHEGKIVDPVGVYYNKKYNLVILHSIVSTKGIEWMAADYVNDLLTKLGAKEVIPIEGVGSQNQESQRAFYYTTEEKNAKALDAAGIEKLNEGIIVGVTSALMLKTKTPLTCIFSETHTNLPDSASAAKVIEVLDKYLGLEVDYRPLQKQAEEFETKIKGMMEKQQEAQKVASGKTVDYIS